MCGKIISCRTCKTQSFGGGDCGSSMLLTRTDSSDVKSRWSVVQEHTFCKWLCLVQKLLTPATQRWKALCCVDVFHTKRFGPCDGEYAACCSPALVSKRRAHQSPSSCAVG